QLPNLDLLSRGARLDSRGRRLSLRDSCKHKKAGLVGPADLIYFSLRGATWFWGSPQICLVYQKNTVGQCPTTQEYLYITSARFSSSRSRTGSEQPDISTRPTASSAACGETPYPRPIRNTCSSSAASRESTRPPWSRSFRNAVSSVLENLSFMAVHL